MGEDHHSFIFLGRIQIPIDLASVLELNAKGIFGIFTEYENPIVSETNLKNVHPMMF